VAAAAGGAAEDRHAGARAEARGLAAALAARLDALSHFHFAPWPVVEDLTVRQAVPALALEEVAPQARPAPPPRCPPRRRVGLG
jgi:U3 small nucleolar RNA-associated protein MPP10